MKTNKRIIALLVVIMMLMQGVSFMAFAQEVVGSLEVAEEPAFFIVQFVDKNEKLIAEMLVGAKNKIEKKDIPAAPAVADSDFVEWKNINEKSKSSLKKVTEDTTFIATYQKIDTPVASEIEFIEAGAPVDKEPEIINDPVDKKLIDDEPIDDEPIDDDPIDDDPIDDDPIDDEPIDDEPIDDEPIDDDPIDDEPIDDEPIDDEPIDDEPIDDEPIDDEPIDEEPVVERSVLVEWLVPEEGLTGVGDTISMKATPVGFDGIEYTIQWQYDAGQGWVDVAGDELILELVIEEDFANLLYGWRIVLTPVEVPEVPETEETVET